MDLSYNPDRAVRTATVEREELWTQRGVPPLPISYGKSIWRPRKQQRKHDTCVPLPCPVGGRPGERGDARPRERGDASLTSTKGRIETECALRGRTFADN